MRKALIYGAGYGGARLYQELVRNEEAEILAFADRARGGSEKFGLPVVFPDEISNCQYKSAQSIRVN